MKAAKAKEEELNKEKEQEFEALLGRVASFRPHSIQCDTCGHGATMMQVRRGVETDWYECPKGHKMGLCFRHMQRSHEEALRKVSCGKCHAVLTKQEFLSGSQCCKSCFGLGGRCSRCNSALSLEEAKFKTGLCNKCFDTQGNGSCSRCNSALSLEEAKFKTGLCNKCFDERSKKVRK